jgi:hypothetical protein
MITHTLVLGNLLSNDQSTLYLDASSGFDANLPITVVAVVATRLGSDIVFKDLGPSALLSNFSVPTKASGDAPFTLTAPTSNSSGAFTYSSSNPAVATVSGSTVTIIATGTTTITATQAATATHGSNSISATFTVTPPPLYSFTSHTFTNAGQTGWQGPELSTVRSAYTTAGATWAQTYLNMTTRGIQEWTVPATGSYTIRAKGAAGGNPGTFGRGRDIETRTELTRGEVIQILVGQQGGMTDNSPQGAGGGGTFVVRGTETPIIVAGGGGGRGAISANEYVNSNASDQTSGNKGGDGSGTLNGEGGINGGGGEQGYAGGGGGLLSNGTGGYNGGGEGGGSFIQSNGVIGRGEGGRDNPSNAVGGFGGGASAEFGGGGGGGGGYSGGGGGRQREGDIYAWASGGGGGSYAIGTMTDYGATNTGHGSVIIIPNFVF